MEGLRGFFVTMRDRVGHWWAGDHAADETTGEIAQNPGLEPNDSADRERLWRTGVNPEKTRDDPKPWWPVAVASLALVLLVLFVLWMPRGGPKPTETSSASNTPQLPPDEIAPEQPPPAKFPLALAEIQAQTSNEGELVSVKVAVQTADASHTPLRFSLGPTRPAEAKIDPDTGVFSWAPREEDGPGIYPILVRVEDAHGEEFDEVSFVVRVAEVNDAIKLEEIEDRSVQAGETMTLVATARDPNIPPRDLRFSLAAGSPRGLTIDAITGALNWPTPESEMAGEFPVTVRVRESGGGVHCAETRFVIAVTRPAPPVVAAIEEPAAPPAAMEEPPPTPLAMDPPVPPPAKPADVEQPPAPVADAASAKDSTEPPLLPVAMIEPAATVPAEPPLYVTNSLGMPLVPIAAGAFRMGSHESAADLAEVVKRPADRFRDELPLHAVRITRPFYMSKHEVTVANFRQFVEAEGYITEAERRDEGGFGFNAATSRFERSTRFNWKNPGWHQTKDHAAVNVSWNDAVEFCRWLSRKERRTYRLPTEAQWEYACRAGTETWYSTGDSDEGLAAAANLGDEQFRRAVRPKYQPITLTSHQEGQPFTVPVGQFEPNAFGVCDMHGNVFEWCSDWYEPGYYEQSPPADPAGPSTGTKRVIRGGGFYSAPFYCRSAYRNGLAPDTAVPYLGFRVVLEDE